MANLSKNRYWAFVVFFENKREFKKKMAEIVRFLDEKHVKYTISPIHLKDKNPDGTKKKPHVHVMVCWDGPTTYKCAADNFGAIAANGHLESVVSARGMYRYFIHADNPEKAQYKDEDRIHGGGFNPAELLSETDKKIVMQHIQKLIRESKATEFAQVSDMLLDSGWILEYNVFTSNTYAGHNRND